MKGLNDLAIQFADVVHKQTEQNKKYQHDQELMQQYWQEEFKRDHHQAYEAPIATNRQPQNHHPQPSQQQQQQLLHHIIPENQNINLHDLLRGELFTGIPDDIR